MTKSAFLAPKVEALVSALSQSGMTFTSHELELLKTSLDSLLFRRPRWWGAWQASAMTGRELRDAVLQHTRLAVERISRAKIPAERLKGLEGPFELALFGGSLVGDEPATYASRSR